MDHNNDGIVDSDDQLAGEYGEYSDMAGGGEEGGELTPEEEDLMNSPDEEL